MNKEYFHIKEGIKQSIESIKISYIFYITFILCISIISIYTYTKDDDDNTIISIISIISIIKGINTIFISMIFGYSVHVYSHRLLFEDILIDIIKEINKIIGIDILKIIPNFVLSQFLVTCKIFDYHDIYHHNSLINKKWYHLIIEFILNIFMEGILLIIINKLFFKKNLLNNYLILLWGLLYATIHIINYNINPSKQHEYHHIDKSKNYGIDLIDILLGSKYKIRNYENLNTQSINILLITPIILLLKNKNIYDKLYSVIF